MEESVVFSNIPTTAMSPQDHRWRMISKKFRSLWLAVDYVFLGQVGRHSFIQGVPENTPSQYALVGGSILVVVFRVDSQPEPPTTNDPLKRYSSSVGFMRNFPFNLLFCSWHYAIILTSCSPVIARWCT